MGLDRITEQIFQFDTEKKEATKALAVKRDEFFAEVTTILEHSQRAQKIINVGCFKIASKEIVDYITTFFPGWRIVDYDIETEKVVIEEDPAALPYSYINEELGFTFKRVISQATPSLNDEQLQEEDPELWERITEPGPRVLKDFGTLSDADLDTISEYMVPGPLTIKLDTPRKLKADERDE